MSVWVQRCLGRRLLAAGGIAATVALLALGTLGCSEATPPGERSVILLTLDTTRADRIGVYGGKAVPTPNLDRIADEGVTFEQAMSPVPLTLPAHSSLMTARYPASLGVRHNGIYRLPDEAVTLAERLGEAGWDTAGFVAAYVLNRGFGIEQGFSTYDDVPVNRFAGGEDQLFLAERSADEVNEAVFDWLDRRGDGKFFLWVHYYDPHDPYEPPEREGRTLRGEGYDREIAYLDACIGDLLDRLETEGVLDRSVLVVAGDHGESLGEHGERTHGLFLYEGAMRIPLLLRAPGGVASAGRSSWSASRPRCSSCWGSSRSPTWTGRVCGPASTGTRPARTRWPTARR
jgi:arylsulfatase A-like enzyme